jgi:hypothetical protein
MTIRSKPSKRESQMPAPKCPLHGLAALNDDLKSDPLS